MYSSMEAYGTHVLFISELLCFNCMVGLLTICWLCSLVSVAVLFCCIVACSMQGSKLLLVIVPVAHLKLTCFSVTLLVLLKKGNNLPL